VIELRILTIEAALGLSLADLAASKRHGFEHAFKAECRFLVWFFGFPDVVARALFLGILLLLSHTVASTILNPAGEFERGPNVQRNLGAVYNNSRAISKGYLGDQSCAVQ
jgi:hypothetical protein